MFYCFILHITTVLHSSVSRRQPQYIKITLRKFSNDRPIRSIALTAKAALIIWSLIGVHMIAYPRAAPLFICVLNPISPLLSVSMVG